jgi:hypothetical protein
LTLALTGLCVCVLCAGATNSSAGTRHVNTWLRSQIAGYERLTWHWQHVMGAAVTPAAAGVTPDALRRWQRLAHAARVQAQHPPHMAAFLCIHRYEGSWTDGGGPYYGGLQMDLGFQGTYGGWLLRTKGTADHWTPLEQIWVAEKALKSRGFWPWPNTARFCGLM